MEKPRPLRIGELSARAGVSTYTIRFYERTGILPPAPRTRSGYRAYPPEAVDHLVFIKKAQTLGLRLADVKEVLEISSGGRQPCEHVRAKVEDRLCEVEARLRDLTELRETLTGPLKLLDTAPKGGGPSGCRCAVIDAAPLGERPNPQRLDN